jgi:hypothetical protein
MAIWASPRAPAAAERHGDAGPGARLARGSRLARRRFGGRARHRNASSAASVSSGASSGRKWPQSIAWPRASLHQSRQTSSGLRALRREAVRAPQRQHRRLDLVAGGVIGLVEGAIDRRAGAIILAGRVNARGIVERGAVMRHELRASKQSQRLRSAVQLASVWSSQAPRRGGDQTFRGSAPAGRETDQ